MHILIIPSWYKSINEPVLGSFFEEQARGLLQEGNKVGIMYSNFYPLKKIFEKKAEYIYYMDDKGIPTYSFAIQSFVPRSRDLNYYYIGIATVRVFKHYVKQNGFPDIIHAHSAFHAGIAAAFLSKKYNIPYVITEHLTHYMTGGINHVDDLEYARKIFTDASRAFAVSNAFKIELTKTLNLTDNTFKVMHNMVSNHFFENAFEKKYIQGEPFIFLINSFLNARKNHELALRALRILIDKKFNVKIRIGGYGEYEPELRRIIASLRLQNHVTLLGSLSRAAVKEEMNNSHAFLLPSKYETFGVVLIESMACGRPVISTNSGGPADIVTEQNGILLHSFEVNDFANAMEQMILQYDKYNQQAISNQCFENYSQQHISRLLMKEYTDVLASNKTATTAVAGNSTNILLTFNYCPYFASQPADYVQQLIDTTNELLTTLKEESFHAAFFVDIFWLQQFQNLSCKYVDLVEHYAAVVNQLQQLLMQGHRLFLLYNPCWIQAGYHVQTKQWQVTETLPPDEKTVWDRGVQAMEIVSSIYNAAGVPLNETGIRSHPAFEKYVLRFIETYSDEIQFDFSLIQPVTGNINFAYTLINNGQSGTTQKMFETYIQTGKGSGNFINNLASLVKPSLALQRDLEKRERVAMDAFSLDTTIYKQLHVLELEKMTDTQYKNLLQNNSGNYYLNGNLRMLDEYKIAKLGKALKGLHQSFVLNDIVTILKKNGALKTNG